MIYNSKCKGDDYMTTNVSKKPRMMRLTDSTHENFRFICEFEERTAEGVLKELIKLYQDKKTKEEK